MNQIPMLFSTPMVKAILNETKNQTRRAVGLDLVNEQPDQWIFQGFVNDPLSGSIAWFKHKETGDEIGQKCPYGKKGDLIWVRETFAIKGITANMPPSKAIEYCSESAVIYKANDTVWRHNWKPSIHMPKKACRIWLKNKGVTLERLQNISPADAIAEGIDKIPGEIPEAVAYTFFKRLWEKINGAESWESNPWVWRVLFEKTTAPKL